MEYKEKILVLFLSPGGIGEVILQTPFFRALREDFPESSIEILLSNTSKIVLKNNPTFKTIHTYQNPIEMLRKLRDMRSQKFNHCYILDKSWKSNYLARIFINSEQYIGFERRSWEALSLTSRVKYDASKAESIYYLDLLRCQHPHSCEPEMFPEDNDFQEVKQLFSFEGSKIVALLAGGAKNPGVGDEPFRRWSVENYCKLAELLAKDDYTILLVGGKGDLEINNRIEKVVKNKVINLTGKLSLVQSGIAISNADLVICHDSGLMHLASCFNSKLLCLFGPTSPHNLLPQKTGLNFIWEDEDIYNPKIRIYGTRSLPQHQLENFFKRLSFQEVYQRAHELLTEKK